MAVQGMGGICAASSAIWGQGVSPAMNILLVFWLHHRQRRGTPYLCHGTGMYWIYSPMDMMSSMEQDPFNTRHVSVPSHSFNTYVKGVDIIMDQNVGGGGGLELAFRVP